MKYFYDLIHTDDKLKSEDGLYSLILLRASGLSLTLNGVRCFLDGSYLDKFEDMIYSLDWYYSEDVLAD